MKPGDSWIQVPPLRGCVLCRYGMYDAAGDRKCMCPDAGLREPTSVELMRGAHGLCGPDARYLDFAGLRS
ncbi:MULTISPECIES: hypothetical protein [unclassified Rhizobacter]|uniref:hypothetical protein n=1 Tax=unclassified Rhizobacter TaxID=2640088 RepID=UPI0006F2452B|nr:MULTISPECIES: hypothetical protein [unclassified Rhizobacter]KQU80261.1 hypothetical protein ASC88_16635 [Rhizobacter sp. Root29]KQW13757.1 hypothetical protein ASC98_16765 [Rhizobacter sp. Root1238]KRB12449.1 hypothetical protein ASE08_28635 [Rhizobacter sp. Root16D2]